MVFADIRQKIRVLAEHDRVDRIGGEGLHVVGLRLVMFAADFFEKIPVVAKHDRVGRVGGESLREVDFRFVMVLAVVHEKNRITIEQFG